MIVRGGLRLDGHKSRALERPIRPVAPPATVVLPLDQGSGAEAVAVVGPGDGVRMGTMIASAAGAAAAVHSPVAGTVRGIVTANTPRGTGRCIVIDNDGSDEPSTPQAPLDWRALPGETLLEHVARAGIAGLGGAAFPTAAKLAAARAAGADWLILNGAECEPWICCDDALMRERATDVVLGAQVMLAAARAEHCVVAIEDDKPRAVAAVTAAIEAARDARLEVRVLPAVFPLGAEGMLVTAVTGREVPRGALPPQVGVVCQNVGTAAALAGFVRDGRPLTSRIVTVTGSGVLEPCNVEARIGTPLRHLVAACGGYAAANLRLIAGGSLTGRLVADDATTVTKGLNCLLVATAADLAARPTEMPCIRCGDCASACPAGLLPQQLLVAARADDATGLSRYGLDACIECGCCDYVCPSSIRLTARFRAARERQHAHEQERQRALDARARFERHQRRIAEQAAAERIEFDAARRRAGAPDRREH